MTPGSTVTLGSGQQVTLNADNTVTVVTNGTTGTEAFSYTVDNGFGTTDIGIVQLETLAVLTPDGVVEGTAGADVITTGYTGDPDGDFVDNNDAILPGTTGDDDSILSFGGDDNVLAGDGNDTVFGGAGNDTLSGDGDNDSLYGEAGDDSLLGGSGDDAALGGDGADYLFGGSGNDTLDGDDNLATGGADTILGGFGDDLILGDYGDDVLDGGGGVDTIFGGAGADLIWGQGGADLIDAGADADVINIQNGFGNDTIIGGEDTATGVDFDSVDASGVTSDLTLDLIGGEQGTITDGTSTAGFTEIEQVTLGSGNDSVNGSTDNDVFATGAGADTINAGSGNDTYDIGTDTDVDIIIFSDGSGDDTVSSFTAPTDNGNGTFSGNDQLDVSGLTDGNGATVNTSDVTVSDTNGDGSGDAILSFPNGETLTLVGVTVAQVSSPNALAAMGIPQPNYIVEGTADADLIDAGYVGDPEGDLVDANDNLAGTNDDSIVAGAGNDTVLAGSGNDTVFGWTGNDSVDAGSGDDTVFGEDGNDTLIGGAGNDLLDGDNASAGADSISGDGGNDTLIGDGGNDTLSGGTGDDQIFAGADDDIVFGGTGNDEIYGAAGNDSIEADEGDDTVFGGDGNDTIIGFEGNDSVLGGAGDDVINTRTSPGTGLPDQGYGTPGNPLFYPADPAANNDCDTVDGGTGDDIILTGDDNDLVLGGDGADTIDAGFDDDSVSGGAGADSIQGNEGNDTISGGADNDIIYGDVATGSADFAFYSQYELDNDGSDLAPDNNADSLIGDGGNDTIFGQDDNDTLEGGSGYDRLDGGVDDDRLDGGTGADTLIGGTGNDSLIGGDGDDVFIYVTGDGLDTISDFNTGNTGTLTDGDATNNDRIDLSAFYDDIWELTADQADDGILNQSNDGVGGVDYSDNASFGSGGIVFSGAAANTNFYNFENTGVVCFAQGTRILTNTGERTVESLQPGDRIVTRDNGVQTIQWIGQRHLDAPALAQRSTLRPVLLSPELTGGDAPLIVSPQHGVLVHLDGEETLVRAIHLAKIEGGAARVMNGCRQVTYFHILFEDHQIVFANGAPSESFFPGGFALAAMTDAVRHEIFTLFPELQYAPADKAYGPKARAFAPFKHLPNHLKALTARSRSRSSIAVMPRRSLMPDRLRMKDAG
ncbi:MAG: Hint domain-containing protein [Marivita sp.]|uniref:Hint domain-containing protein n=1 Tax=Marivita sp. TaxID=2003365 RepID=UPI003EFA019B